MIVFTATNTLTDTIYVGSARDSLEEHWARLIVQAEEGNPGDFLADIRVSGDENFKVETYDFADTPAEARELVRDASETLGATVIRTGKLQTVKDSRLRVSASQRESEKKESISKEGVIPAKSAEEIKKDIEAFLKSKGMQSVDESYAKNASDSDRVANAKSNRSTEEVGRPVSEVHGNIPRSAESSKASATQTTLSASQVRTAARPVREAKSAREKRSEQKEHGPVTKVDINAYLASQAASTLGDKARQQAEVALRKTDSTKEAEDMKEVMMRIEMKRRQNRTQISTAAKTKRKASAAEASAKNLSLSTTNKESLKIEPTTPESFVAKVTAMSKAKKDKLPEGRVSSSTKEKRIKEQIAKERMEREAAHAAKVAAEAKEMAELMARLDQKTKEKERIRRRR